jgi:hypothetical protein
MSFHEIDNQRALIDRRAIADRLSTLKAGKTLSGDALRVLRGALEYGRAEIAKRLTLEPGNGRAAARATAFLHDQLVRLTYDFVAERLLEQPVEALSLVGLGGTGRGEMAPFSDLDLMFLTDKVPTTAQERAEGWPFDSIDSAADCPVQEGHDRPHRLPRGALAVGRGEIVRPRHEPLPQGGRRRDRRRVRCRQAL